MNRIDIFRNLVYDEIRKEVNEQIIDDIVMEKFDEFIDLCNELEAKGESIESVKCHYENGELYFDITYK